MVISYISLKLLGQKNYYIINVLKKYELSLTRFNKYLSRNWFRRKNWSAVSRQARHEKRRQNRHQFDHKTTRLKKSWY